MAVSPPFFWIGVGGAAATVCVTALAGFSAGAAMAVILGATYPDLFAAIAVGSGLEYRAGTDAGSGSTVTLRTTLEPQHAVLEVEDNGPGLAPDDLAHVFERFWRASDLPGGCGLGLAIIAEIARRHGGQASASLVQPHGLRVRIELPRRSE